jgi:cell division septation protein DedD
MSRMEMLNPEIQPNPETPANPAQKQSKRIFIGFAATISVGLVLAGWYVGGRIFAAEKGQPVAIAKPVPLGPRVPVIAKTTTSAPVITEPIAAAAIAEPVAITPEQPKPAPRTQVSVDPRSGEVYLQLAAMGPRTTGDYIKTLDAKGIHTRIAPGPTQDLYRILIGPYADKAALEKEQQELQAAGIETFVRAY